MTYEQKDYNKLAQKIELLSADDLAEYLTSENLTKLHNFKLFMDDIYYNTGEDTITDWRYDMLKDILQLRDLDYVPPVGATLRKGENRVALPFWLGSADKITPKETDVLRRWKSNNKASSYIVSDKLDGVSCLLSCKNGRIKLFTRGDGEIGADISYLADYFSLPDMKNLTINVRGELIMTKEDFEPYRRKGLERGKLSSGSKDYKNARSMVAGLVNAKTARHGLSKVRFVAYEIVGNETMPKPSTQLKILTKVGFHVVRYVKVKDVTVESLSELYLQFKESSEYEIDGIIVQSNVEYDRNTSGNPDYMFAFKMLTEDNVHPTVVKKVEWNVSKWGQLKPVVIVEPVILQDITMSRASGHNAKYIFDNNIGPGAIIKLTRSKDVIPYIVDIVTPAEEPEMPSVQWIWDKNKVNALVVEYDTNICIKLIANFFAKLGIKQVSEATVQRLYDNGLNTLMKIISAPQDRFLQVPRFKSALAKRTYVNIHEGLKNVKVATILGASGIFGNGVGRKRMEVLLSDFPDLLTVYKTMSPDKLKRRVMAVEGFSDIMADKIVKNIKYADRFINKITKYTIFKKEVRVSNTLAGKKFVMSGFRDKTLEEKIVERGGKMVSSVSGKTSGVIVKSKGGNKTGKVKKAFDLGIPIYTKDEFITKFIT